MKKISFVNSDISLVLKNKQILKAFIGSIFEEEHCEFESVSYVFCSDAYLLPLNRKYLNHDSFTDIITFTLSGSSLPIISEIYISVERVKDNAENLKMDFVKELYRVMIHGILHLCGYSDHTKKLKTQMRGKEDYYLSKLDSFI